MIPLLLYLLGGSMSSFCTLFAEMALHSSHKKVRTVQRWCGVRMHAEGAASTHEARRSGCYVGLCWLGAVARLETRTSTQGTSSIVFLRNTRFANNQVWFYGSEYLANTV